MFKQDSGSSFSGKLISKMKRHPRPLKCLVSSDSIPDLPPMVPESPPFTPPMQSLLVFSLPLAALSTPIFARSTSDLMTPRYRSSSAGDIFTNTPGTRNTSRSATPNAPSIFLSSSRSTSFTPPRLTLSPSPLLSVSRSAKGPKVKAYMYTQSYQSPASHLPLKKCSVCDEHLSQRLQNEVLVVFKDKLLMHAQCMQVVVSYNIESAIASKVLTTSLTKKDWILASFKDISIPSDTDVVEGIISAMQTQFGYKLDDPDTKPQSVNFMRLANTLERSIPNTLEGSVPNTPTRMPTSLFGPSRDSISSEQDAIEDLESECTFSSGCNSTADKETKRPVSRCSVYPAPSPSPHKTSGLGISATTELDYNPLSFPNNLRLARLLVRDLTASTVLSSMRSPSPDPSIMTVQTISANIECHRQVSPETLKTDFINALLDSSSQVTLAHLVKLGELRIVDNLSVMLNQSCYRTRIVYLFENYLVVSPENHESEMIQFKLLECTVSTFESQLKLKTVDREILLLAENGIIEKWVVAVCDRSTKFPVEFISSSIALPQYRTDRSEKTSHYQVVHSYTLRKDQLHSLPIPESASTIKGLSISLLDKNHVSDTSPRTDVISDSYPDTKSSSDLDSDLDSDSDSDSDSESDSDAELIEHALRSTPAIQLDISRPQSVVESITGDDATAATSNQPGWDDLVAQVDKALVL